MKTIQATVNSRLLTKASRLFTGTLSGRIIEVLQNARRAGARHVTITNRKGLVTVRDDGQGIDDFAKLLDLGGSGWQPGLEESEDPAGVGLFCLAPRALTVRSRGQILSIPEQGWTGQPIEIRSDPKPPSARRQNAGAGPGTELSFPDEPWTTEDVATLACFTGLCVSVDGETCRSKPFLTGDSAHYPELGCRIQVIQQAGLPEAHQQAIAGRRLEGNCLLSFHGQVVNFPARSPSHHDLAYLVELTGEPTGIRLMLPARTCLVENDALKALHAALEREAFLYLQRQGRHRLFHADWLRARELGIELPEAEPCFSVGLLFEDVGPEPVKVEKPHDLPLERCYRAGEELCDADEANAHLLAALGQLDQPFVPVLIDCRYDGYSWAKLPCIQKVEVAVGRKLAESWVYRGELECVQDLSITCRTSDGRVFSSPVCMAVRSQQDKRSPLYQEDHVYVTPQARERVSPPEIWFHLGGFYEEGDTYETQDGEFREDLEAFWMRLAGPDETLRARLMECVSDLKRNWRSITLLPEGQIKICLSRGRCRTISSPDQQPRKAKSRRR